MQEQSKFSPKLLRLADRLDKLIRKTASPADSAPAMAVLLGRYLAHELGEAQIGNGLRIAGRMMCIAAAEEIAKDSPWADNVRSAL